MKKLAWVGIVVLLACSAAMVIPKPRPLSATAEIRHMVVGTDTLVMNLSWTNPADDGKGAIDSMRVRFVGIMSDSSFIFRAPAVFPSTKSLRVAIPVAAYAGVAGSATYQVFSQLTNYRRGANSVPLTSNQITITLIDAAPAAPTGVTFSAVKIP